MSRSRELLLHTWHEYGRQRGLWTIGKGHTIRDYSRIGIVSALKKQNGIARGAELQFGALRREGRAASLIDGSQRNRIFYEHVSHLPASTYVFHEAGPETAHLIHSVLPEARRSWRVGYWAWELAEAPPGWGKFSALLNEIWAPSTFSARSLSRVAQVPIEVVPHRVPACEPRRRKHDLPFTVLVLADSRSSFSRKNPWAAVRAFLDAFKHSTQAQLVVKLSGNAGSTEDFRAALANFTNVKVISDRLNEVQMHDLYCSTDALISMHRAEGFGLPMLEAMAHGVPVVATGWSGNTDFMTKDNSVLVPYKLVPIRDHAGVYGNKGSWAEPDTAVASRALLRLSTDTAFYRSISESAHRYVVSQQEIKLPESP